MLKLTKPFSVPPSGYVYQDADTKMFLSGINLNDLVARAIQHRRANSLPISDTFAAEVEDYLCHKNPQGMCYESDPLKQAASDAPGRFPLSSGKIRAGMTIIMETISRWGRNVVTQAEANRRAHLCVDCPHNISEQECIGCTGWKTIINQFIGPRTTDVDGKLWACDVCECFSKLAVHLDDSTLIKAARGREYPKNIKGKSGKVFDCWRSQLNGG